MPYFSYTLYAEKKTDLLGFGYQVICFNKVKEVYNLWANQALLLNKIYIEFQNRCYL